MDSASTSTSVELLMLEKDGNGLQWIPMPSIKVGRRRFAAFATNTTTKRGILVVGGRDNEHDSLFTMEFLQEPSKDDIVYWSLLNPPPLEKPALATEADTTIHEPTQSEEWIQDLIRQKDGYQNQVGIRFGVDNPPATPTTKQLAIPPEERIKRLRKILDKFLASVGREVNLVRQLARQVRLSGVVVAGKAPDASSVSSLSAQSEETWGRPDLAPDAQGRRERQHGHSYHTLHPTNAATHPSVPFNKEVAVEKPRPGLLTADQREEDGTRVDQCCISARRASRR